MITDGDQGHDTLEPPWIEVHKGVIPLASAPASAGIPGLETHPRESNA
jgi:hypothetical protein